MAIAPEELRDPWWKELPTREAHGIANTKDIAVETDLCGVCGVCRYRHYQAEKMGCTDVAYVGGHLGSDWRIAYFVGEYDKPVDHFIQTWDTGVGVDTDEPLPPIQVMPPRPADTTP